MNTTIVWSNKKYQFDLNKGIDLSLPYGGEKSAFAWGSKAVKFTPVQYGDWVGAVEQGASVNFFDIQFNPHGNGTHTEWAGHLLTTRGSINSVLKRYWFKSMLIDAQVVNGGYLDLPLTAISLEKPEALIIRSFQNDLGPQRIDFWQTNPPFLLPDQCAYLADIGINHLLIDLPSIDPEQDNGALAAHKAFWQFDREIREHATITELICVPSHLASGVYLLNLQVAPFENDASPSRPLLYELVEVEQ